MDARAFQRKSGRPANRIESEARASGERGDGDAGGNSYTAYVGLVDGKCRGYCFGYNYLRHLRDAKIVVTCNPSAWEGDFRTWEAFVSGAMGMVDTMYVLPWMPNPPIDGTHFVMYDPTKKEDFMAKLKYYSDPANADEVRTIARAGYEFVTWRSTGWIISWRPSEASWTKSSRTPPSARCFVFHRSNREEIYLDKEANGMLPDVVE